jgi:hypothetical protein
MSSLLYTEPNTAYTPSSVEEEKSHLVYNLVYTLVYILVHTYIPVYIPQSKVVHYIVHGVKLLSCESI